MLLHNKWLSGPIGNDLFLWLCFGSELPADEIRRLDRWIMLEQVEGNFLKKWNKKWAKRSFFFSFSVES